MFEAVASLSDDLTLLFIEHDMDLVFRFATPHHRDGRRRASSPKARRPRSPPIRGVREVYLGNAHETSWLSRCLRCTTCAPAMATRSCSTTCRFELPENGSLAVLGRNGVGKSTLLLTIMGYTQCARGSIVWRGARHHALPPHRRAPPASAGWRRNARSFPR